jgi:SAM-dependent methyltransferase
MKAMDIAGWENMYRSGERGAEDAPTRLLVETAAKLKPGVAIDLACGTGRNALFLAEQRWTVTAVDASQTAIQILQQRAAERGLDIAIRVADLTSPAFVLPHDAFDLVVIAYYLQRDLFTQLKPALRKDGIVLAIVHTPNEGEQPSYKRAAPGELRSIFAGWEILHSYEGPSRDPAHRRPVAEIVAQRD